MSDGDKIPVDSKQGTSKLLVDTDKKGSKSPRSVSPVPNIRIADLKKQRGILKKRLTLFEKFIQKFDENIVINSAQRLEINLRIESLSVVFSEFNSTQTELELLDDLDSSSHLEYRESFESIYYSVLTLAKWLIREDDQMPIFSSPSAMSSPVAIKLPEIKLPAFDGSFDRWLEFRNSYVTMIHNRMDLDPIQKFHYLKSSLTGSALQVISALEFTALNYGHAWDLLESRFHNNRLLIHNHVKSLFCATSITKESPVQIRKLIDNTLRNLRALNSLNEPTDSWDTLIIYLVVSKLDPSTEREWESHKGSLLSNLHGNSKSLKLNDLITFLRNRADMLDMIVSNNLKIISQSKVYDSKQSNDSKKQMQSYSQTSQQSHTHVASSKSSSDNKNNKKRICPLCGKDHALYSCSNFLNMSVQDRLKVVSNKNLCINCIRIGNHSPSDCTFSPCKLCQLKHNTLLHIDSSTSNVSLSAQLIDHSLNNNNTCELFNTLQPVLLSTALIYVLDLDNKYITARALLDSGSQNCFITESLCKRLNLPVIQSTIRISGVGQTVSQSTQKCNIKIRSRVNDYSTNLQCLVLPNITSKMPSIDFNSESIRIPNHIELADPTFDVPSDIDILMGADIFWELLNSYKIKLSSGPYLHDSKVGWIISGPIRNNKSFFTKQIQCNTAQINYQLRQFWELEEITNLPIVMSHEDKICEKLFEESTKRDNDSRFSVRMPLKESADSLGDSFVMAQNRFLALERKLDRSLEYKTLYCNFIREYENLGHMTRLTDNIHDISKPFYILPHHGVYRESSLTTKLRVVFDASAITSSKKSLNDIQYIGPPLQNDIISILLRFRQYKYVACADIEKMYRQILIQPDQRNLQLILWRENRDVPIQLYRLNTVTYGTACAPYLSIRCLRQLANDCNDDVISRTIYEDFYVDDLITGNDDLESLLTICNKTSKVLNSGCFSLRKWTFNYDVTLDSVVKDLGIGENCQSKTLGLGWSNKSDELHFTTKIVQNSSVLTKRTMMSIISQIYDPLGLLAPAIISAKVLLQKLWLSKLDWDDEVPTTISSSWLVFIDSLQSLHEIRVPRHVMFSNPMCTELHIFSDASQEAYGACAYIRSCKEDSPSMIRLLCAKSKLAPIKTISIPRLELCGALIGAKLYHKICNAMRIEFNKVYFWTDSTIVQGWLRMNPHSLKTFVQNRVVQINELTGDAIWRHVKGIDNPADMITRGINLNHLKYNDDSLWWCGPSFLQQSNANWARLSTELISHELPELKSETVNLTISYFSELINFERFSSFNRLLRASAYCLRFISNTRATLVGRDRITGPLTVDELSSAEQMLTRTSQLQSFPREYHNLKNKLPVTIKNDKSVNKISGLNIFMDKDCVIRVGGRLCNAIDFDYNKKHPVLLSGKHRFTLLLCICEHKRLLHAGPQLLVSNMRERWWVLGAKNLAKQVVNKCVTCARMKGQTLTPIMGNLPSERLEAGFPFMQCGVDYAGPVFVLNRKGRGAKLIKSYICLFICFATRAIHLELVSSLSTQDYLLALKRFISRRGKPHHIFSDNGKNFIGAEKDYNNMGIHFSFIPPYTPHFGGLWEAGVKSCKHHLRRVLGNANLTFEEFSTVLTQIEAVLNSRPLTPLSTDPTDFAPLTPAHFLIGRSLTAPACEDLTMKPILRLARYDRVEQLRQHFWQRWSKEYVSELQRRTKWKADSEDLKNHSLVVIKEDNVPPFRWKLGRIIRLFPGKDGVSRVAEIRTATGIIRRACSRICPLPVLSSSEQQPSPC